MRATLQAIFATLAVFLIVSVAAIYWIGDRAIRKGKEVVKRRSDIDLLNTTLSTLKDAETGQRGYLLTINDQYLAPYEEARSRIHDELARLLQSLDLKERTSVDFERLVDLSSRKLDELQQTIDLARRGEAAKALDEVRADRGKVLMDQIRDCVLRIEDRDRRSLESAQRALDRAELQRNGIFGAVALVNLAFLFWAYQKIRHEAKVRAEARFETERQKDLLRVTLLSIGDAVIITDVEGRITLMNQVAEELTGWLLKDAKGLDCATVFRIKNQQTGQSVESPVAKVLREGLIVGLANHSLLVRRDGTEIPIDDSGAPIRELNGAIRGVVLVFRDFTEYKTAEKELRDARDELAAANRAKNHFFATLSHELRTPLTPILATLSSWADDDTLPQSLRSDVQMMRRNIELEARLIDELMDLNRIIKGKISLHLEIADVHELIRAVLRMYESEIYSHGLTVQTDLEAERHHVNGDLGRLQQAFWNILKNAAEHTPEGGRIAVRTFNADATLCVSFTDTGVGMSAETLQRLFKPFEEKSTDSPLRSQGLGLGLSISRALVVRQGGDIVASSKGEGFGSEFLVTLPAVAPASETATSEPTPATATATADRRLKILLAEDHADTAHVLAKLLSHFGHEVDIAGTSADAIELYRRKKYDLFLSDLGLPDGSGIELLQKFKEIRAVPAIALTGFGMEEDIVRAQESGFFSHLTKPVNFKQLRQLINRVPLA